MKPLDKGYSNEWIANQSKVASAIYASSYLHDILKMCYKNTLVQGWGGGKAKAYYWVQGWVGVLKIKGHFGAYVLYG